MYGLVTVNLNAPPATATRQAFAIGQQVERALAQFCFHHAGSLAAESHAAGAREGFVIAAAYLGADASHGADEVIDHAVGVGMVDVEPVQFAIGRQIDAGLALQVEAHTRGIHTRLLAGQCRQPVRHGVGADGGGENGGC